MVKTVSSFKLTNVYFFGVVFVNGKFCKNPKEVNAKDFMFRGLNIPGHTDNAQGSNVTAVFVDQLPARVDFAPHGLNPPHTHPRATELFTVLEGTLLVGFVSSNQDGNRFFAQVLYKGDAFIFPIGMIHFQFNIGKYPAVALAAFGSQNPGTITIADAVFGSDPPIDPNVLAKAFMLDKEVVEILQKKFGPHV